MKLAVIGSRNLTEIRLEDYIPAETNEIVSGGAQGVDKLAEEYAKRYALPLTLFLPQYQKYGKCAPLKRNEEIAAYADEALIFWDGRSRGTAHAVACFQSLDKPVRIIVLG